MKDINTRELLRLAVPSIAFAVLTNGYRLVDQFWMGRVSTAAQAAVGTSMFVLILFYAAFALVAAGVAPLVARTTGAEDPDGRRRILGAGLWGGAVLAVVLSLVGGFGAPLIADALGLSGETNDACRRYLAAISFTILPLVLTPIVDHAFISMGNGRAPMVLHVVSLALNAALTPLLAIRFEMGEVGAALASNGSRLVTTSIGLWLLWRAAGMRWQFVRPDELVRIVRVGMPVSLRVAAYAGVYWLVVRFAISPLGPHVNAALGIGFTALEGFTWPTFHGLSIAVASFVGRALGAGRPDDAWRSIRKALPFATALGLGASAAFWFGGRFFTGLFAADPAVHAAAIEYAHVLAFSQLAVAWEALTDGVLDGAGDTVTGFWTATPLNALRVPLAWWLGIHLGLGAFGVWWAINITSYLKTAVKVVVVARGRWSRLEI